MIPVNLCLVGNTCCSKQRVHLATDSDHYHQDRRKNFDSIGNGDNNIESNILILMKNCYIMYPSFRLISVAILILIVSGGFSQNETEFIPPGYEEITEKPSEGFGAIEKCGEGSSRGKMLCVPYYQCDSETRTIIMDGRTDGFGGIDIRFGTDSPCDHYLDVCCKIPEEGIPTSTEGVEVPPPSPTDKPNLPTPQQPSFSWICGVRNDNGIDFKITGNEFGESEYGEFPWMVAILKTKYNPQNDAHLICGGSLIAPNIVLTGAHCVHKLAPADMKIRVGEWDTQTQKERLPYQERNVKRIIVHENFNPKVLFNDVALLLLESPAEEAEHVGTICLPEQNQVFNTKECIATGWGKDKFDRMGAYQTILKKIILPTVPKDECQQKLRTTRLGKFFVLDNSFMCAGGEEGKDTCTGDGGSPLVCPDPMEPKRYVQAGIVAWGIGCGGSVPAVYVDLGLFRTWIDSKINEINTSR